MFCCLRYFVIVQITFPPLKSRFLHTRAWRWYCIPERTELPIICYQELSLTSIHNRWRNNPINQYPPCPPSFSVCSHRTNLPKSTTAQITWEKYHNPHLSNLLTRQADFSYRFSLRERQLCKLLSLGLLYTIKKTDYRLWQATRHSKLSSWGSQGHSVLARRSIRQIGTALGMVPFGTWCSFIQGLHKDAQLWTVPRIRLRCRQQSTIMLSLSGFN